MKAVVYEKYGAPEVLKLKDIAKPHPADNEILVKIKATTVTSGDVRLRSSNFPAVAWLMVRMMYGFFKPKKTILGHEFSGIVEQVGKSVKNYQVGDEVIGTPTLLKTGTYTEYLSIPENRSKGVLGLKPKNLSFNEAAALPIGGMTALYLLNKGDIKQNQNVLIFGASGSVGSMAIQLAKQAGANVTAVCSTKNVEMVNTLGANSVIDYKTQDFSTMNQKYDVIFDAVGKLKKSDANKVLTKNGKFLTVKAITKPNQLLFNKLCQLVSGSTMKPYIDRTYFLEDIVDAHAYVDTGRKKGNVIIEVAETNK